MIAEATFSSRLSARLRSSKIGRQRSAGRGLPERDQAAHLAGDTDGPRCAAHRRRQLADGVATASIAVRVDLPTACRRALYFERPAPRWLSRDRLSRLRPPCGTGAESIPRKTPRCWRSPLPPVTAGTGIPLKACDASKAAPRISTHCSAAQLALIDASDAGGGEERPHLVFVGDVRDEADAGPAEAPAEKLCS